MGTYETILALRIFIQIRITEDKHIFIAFVDTGKALNNINWTVIFKKVN